MPKLKKYFSKKLQYAPEKTLYDLEGMLLRFISPGDLKSLEKRFAEVNLGLIIFEIKNFYHNSNCRNEDLDKLILQEMAYLIRELAESYISSYSLCHIGFTAPDTIAILLNTNDSLSEFFETALLIQVALNNQLNARIFDALGYTLNTLCGCSLLTYKQGLSLGQSFYRAYNQAKRLACSPEVKENLPTYKLFQEILDSSRLTVRYQPIIRFTDGDLIGWEVFIRGPSGTPLFEPEALFHLAQETDHVVDLTQCCLDTIFNGLDSLSPKHKIFINVHPANFQHSGFTAKELRNRLTKHNLAPDNIVIELSLGKRMDDINFFIKRMSKFKEYGFNIAMDNIGTGDSCMRFIPQFQPEFLKLDLSMTRNIDTDPVHKTIVESLLFMAERINSKLLGMGIETETELTSLIDMGVHGGQGFLLGEPVPRRIEPKIKLPCQKKHKVNTQICKLSGTVSDLCRPPLTVGKKTTVGEVKELLQNHPHISSVVVTQGKTPLGLLMQYDMNRQLSTQFGMSLYLPRDIERIMNPAPLVLDGNTSIEEAANLAMSRPAGKVYDDIIITTDGEVLGVVSVQRMLDHLASTQVELAKGANPLTGLPGNVAIEREIDMRMNQHVVTSLVYTDLDHFKVYNDIYGFDHGDRIIKFTAEVLQDALDTHGSADDFVGHVGGDDFVMLTGMERSDTICQYALDNFCKNAGSFYSEEDVNRGFIVGKGRDGNISNFPLISLSIAVVDCDFSLPFTMSGLSHRVAEVKKASKAISGSSLVREPFIPD